MNPASALSPAQDTSAEDGAIKKPRGLYRVACPQCQSEVRFEVPEVASVVLCWNCNNKLVVRVHDIEELGGLGKRLGACPYYGTRKAARLAEVGLYSSLRAPGNGAGGSRMPRSRSHSSL